MRANILSSTADHAGGGLYTFEGSLDDGTFFMAGAYDVTIVNADPLDYEKWDTEYDGVWTQEWIGDHYLEGLCDYDYVVFMTELLRFLKSEEQIELDVGYDEAIARYIKCELDSILNEPI